MKHTLFLCVTMAATSIAATSFAAGSDSTEPPVKTETTQICENGLVWDTKTKSCIQVQGGLISDDEIYKAAREMAYDGQYENALKVLDQAENQNDPRILNYKGFANRKAGRVDEGMEYYQAALRIDPDYILARSYMGQALISEGDTAGAQAQLAEIAARGGQETWAYGALEKALNGQASDW
jgi:tetratricopeptide (TPR) repeat protein